MSVWKSIWPLEYREVVFTPSKVCCINIEHVFRFTTAYVQYTSSTYFDLQLQARGSIHAHISTVFCLADDLYITIIIIDIFIVQYLVQIRVLPGDSRIFCSALFCTGSYNPLYSKRSSWADKTRSCQSRSRYKHYASRQSFLYVFT